MKKWKCYICNCIIDVEDNYKPEYCCKSDNCDNCTEMPINPKFCSRCEYVFVKYPAERWKELSEAKIEHASVGNIMLDIDAFFRKKREKECI